MKKLMMMKSLCRSIFRRSQVFSFTSTSVNDHVRRLHLNSPSSLTPYRRILPSDCLLLNPFEKHIGSARFFSEDVSHMPSIKDPEIEGAFKDLMATNWDELPPSVVEDVKNALSKSTGVKEEQEVLKNVFRAAEAVEEFTGILISLKMEMDDMIGLSGENVKPVPEEHARAMQTVFDRYGAYLGSFGPEENYLKKKVETELGTKMIYLKMRCAGLNAEWGKVTVLGTSGISGSYIEQRA